MSDTDIKFKEWSDMQRATADGLLAERFFNNDGSMRIERCNIAGDVVVNYEDGQLKSTDIFNENGVAIMHIDYDEKKEVSGLYFGSLGRSATSSDYSAQRMIFERDEEGQSKLASHIVMGAKPQVYLDTDTQEGIKRERVFSDAEHTQLLRTITYSKKDPSIPNTVEVYDKEGNIAMSLKCDSTGCPSHLTEYIKGGKKEISLMGGKPDAVFVVYDKEPDKIIGYDFDCFHTNQTVKEGIEKGRQRAARRLERRQKKQAKVDFNIESIQRSDGQPILAGGVNIMGKVKPASGLRIMGRMGDTETEAKFIEELGHELHANNSFIQYVRTDYPNKGTYVLDVKDTPEAKQVIENTCKKHGIPMEKFTKEWDNVHTQSESGQTVNKTQPKEQLVGASVDFSSSNTITVDMSKSATTVGGGTQPMKQLLQHLSETKEEAKTQSQDKTKEKPRIPTPKEMPHVKKRFAELKKGRF